MAGQIAIATAAFAEIKFRWELLRLPGTPILSWMDLNPGMPMGLNFTRAQLAVADTPRYHDAHTHGEGDKPHPLIRTLTDGRRYVMGQIWTRSGRIDLDVRLEADPQLAKEVLGMEAFHAVDIFWMTDAHREELMRRWNKPGTSWWEVNSYSDEYFFLAGEAWMFEGLGAYSDYDLGPNPFLHDAGVEPADVRAILGLPRTDAPVVYGKSRIYHDADHRVRAKAAATALISTADRRACKVCDPREML